MRVRLMYPDRDWEEEPALTARFRYFRPGPPAPETPLEHELSRDLALDTLLGAMADGDEYLLDAARRALLSGGPNDISTLSYRQAILRDCLRNPAVVRELYALAVETIGDKRRYAPRDFLGRPHFVLYYASEALRWFTDRLGKLQETVHAQAGSFESEGFTSLFERLRREFSPEYLAAIRHHLEELRFRQGVFLSAALGRGNEGTSYMLHRRRADRRAWLQRLLGPGNPAYTFHLHERDEAGARFLEELQDRGINQAANVLAQSADHVLSFFHMLRAELAFYVGCLNLYDRLVPLGAPICFPQPTALGTRVLGCTGLYDVCLALGMGRKLVGNSLRDGRPCLVVITGANQGGKSTFLRAIGLAQLMMQCGLFVGAESFRGELCSGLFTHFRREEDATMRSGRLDEELARMSQIADQIRANGMLLCNESFASTNEREGSEIARQVLRALLERHIRVFCVTHLHDLARSLFDRHLPEALFLRAERLAERPPNSLRDDGS